MITIDSLDVEIADRDQLIDILKYADIEENLYLELKQKIARLIKEYYVMHGYVYVIYVGMGLYKIGMTERFYEERLNELEETRIVKIIETDHPKLLEKQLHDKFEKRRLVKFQELFKLRDTDLVYIHLLEGLSGPEIKEMSLLE